MILPIESSNQNAQHRRVNVALADPQKVMA